MIAWFEESTKIPWTELFAFLSTALSAYLAFRIATLKTALDKTEIATVKAADEVAKIHVAVNSKETSTAEEIKQLREELRKMSEEKATLVERESASAAEAQEKTIAVLTGVIKEAGHTTAREVNGSHAKAPRTEQVQDAANTIVDALTTVTEKTGETVVTDLTDVIEKDKPKDQPNNEPKT